MSTIAERLNEAIKAMGKKKTQVAKDLGITDAAISSMCLGKSKPSNQTISMFCQRYGVNRAWLETGEGPMMPERSREEEIADYTARMIRGDNAFQKALVDLILTRTPEELQVIQNAFEDLAEQMKKDRS